jgi:hypothetical protein
MARNIPDHLVMGLYVLNKLNDINNEPDVSGPYGMSQWEGSKKKFDKLKFPPKKKKQVQNSVIFKVEPKHMNAGGLPCKSVFTDEIWLEMDARPRIKLFAIYQPIKIW